MYIKQLAAGICASIFVSTAAFADTLTFTLINKTSETITHFYTSPVGVNDWEEDVFADQVLEPGESMEITIADGRRTCKYDLRFDFEGSTKLETTTDTADLCETGSYTLTE